MYSLQYNLGITDANGVLVNDNSYNNNNYNDGNEYSNYPVDFNNENLSIYLTDENVNCLIEAPKTVKKAAYFNYFDVAALDDHLATLSHTNNKYYNNRKLIFQNQHKVKRDEVLRLIDDKYYQCNLLMTSAGGFLFYTSFLLATYFYYM